MLQGNQQALQLRQADLAAASSAGSVSPGATVGHRPLSRAHSSPVVGKHTKIIILTVFFSFFFFFGGGGGGGVGVGERGESGFVPFAEYECTV